MRTIGGARSVLDRYPARRHLGTGLPGNPGEPCVAGQTWQWDGFSFAILHPVGGADWSNDNASSCVLLIRGRGVSLLLPGDIPAEVEATLVAGGQLPTMDLLIAPHHGSRTSSSPDFVQATQPRYVIFSTGFRHRWHFPAPSVEARWRASGACLLNTGEEGALQFEITPDTPLRLVRRQRLHAPGLWLARPR